MQRQKIALILLRFSLAFALIYAAISAFLNPSAWIGFLPLFVGDFFSLRIFLSILSSIQVVIALFVLFAKNPFYPSLIGAFLVFGILIFNLGAFDILFRDFSIFLSAISLAILYRNESTQKLEDVDKQVGNVEDLEEKVEDLEEKIEEKK